MNAAKRNYHRSNQFFSRPPFLLCKDESQVQRQRRHSRTISINNNYRLPVFSASIPFLSSGGVLEAPAKRETLRANLFDDPEAQRPAASWRRTVFVRSSRNGALPTLFLLQGDERSVERNLLHFLPKTEPIFFLRPFADAPQTEANRM